MNKRKYINKNKKNKMSSKDQVKVMSLFPTPVVLTNIGRDFTKDELQLFLTDILSNGAILKTTNGEIIRF